MTLLILGLLLWTAAHLFKRVLPAQRAAMGKAGRPIVALAIVASVVLMVIGYRMIEGEPLYTLPAEAYYVNNLAMLIALFLMDIGRVKGVVRHYLRHPMLLAVIIWSAAHLLVNGTLASLVLFGGIGLWAIVEIAVINRAEGPWQRPEKGSFAKDGIVLAIALVLYAAILWIHDWLGHPAFALF